MVKSIFSKVENYAWFWESFQIIRFRLDQQVRVWWRFERPATDTQHCVCWLVLVTVVYGGRREEATPLCEKVFFWPQNSADPQRKLDNYMLHILLKKFEVEIMVLSLTFCLTVYMPRSIPPLTWQQRHHLGDFWKIAEKQPLDKCSCPLHYFFLSSFSVL